MCSLLLIVNCPADNIATLADVVQTQDDPSKFIFYELYTDDAAIAYHQEQSYFKDVVAFFESGGAEVVVKKATAKFMTE